jgi:hypothetical protein
MKIKISGSTVWILEDDSFPANGIVICNGEPDIEYLGSFNEFYLGYKIRNPTLFLWLGEIEKVEG